MDVARIAALILVGKEISRRSPTKACIVLGSLIERQVGSDLRTRILSDLTDCWLVHTPYCDIAVLIDKREGRIKNSRPGIGCVRHRWYCCRLRRARCAWHQYVGRSGGPSWILLKNPA